MCLFLCSCGTISDTSVSANTNSDIRISSEVTDKKNKTEQSKFDNFDTSVPEIIEEGFKINENIISELGMTYSQLAEKYGNPKGIYNTYVFENGYGRYGWKSNEGKYFANMENAGGCNMIDGVDIGELLSISNYPISFDKLVDQYGFVIDSAESEVRMDELYWVELTHPLYDNISFIFATTEYGSIDKDTSCCITMNADCLDARPILLN